MLHCLPDSAWADGNLAEVAGQLDKRVEHLNQSQPDPGPRADRTPCRYKHKRDHPGWFCRADDILPCNTVGGITSIYLPGNPKNYLMGMYAFNTLRYGTPESGGRALPELARSVAATTRPTSPTLFSRIRFHLSRGLESSTALLRKERTSWKFSCQRRRVQYILN